MNLRVIFRPACWAVGHLWEFEDYPAAPFYRFWFCDRCGLRSYVKPEGW